MPCRFQEHAGPHHVGVGERPGAEDGAVNVGLSGKVDHGLYGMLLKHPGHDVLISDVAPDKAVALVVTHPFEIVRVAGIGDRVKIDEHAVRIGAAHVMNEI